MNDEQKGIAEAESLIEDLGFNTLPIRPIDVANEISCDAFKVVMEFQSFSSEKILGKAVGDNNGALIYINDNIIDRGRKNFTAAHEVGHVSMHIIPQHKMVFECGTKEINNPFDDPIEKQANGFASGLLLPEKLINDHWGGETNWKIISELSELSGASLEATFRRLSYLDRSPLAMVIHKDGRFKRFVATDNFGFYLERTPLSTEQKELCVDTKQFGFPDDFDTVDASDWINTYLKGTTLAALYASTILLNEGFTYTLLTYDDDCIEED